MSHLTHKFSFSTCLIQVVACFLSYMVYIFGDFVYGFSFFHLNLVVLHMIVFVYDKEP